MVRSPLSSTTTKLPSSSALASIGIANLNRSSSLATAAMKLSSGMRVTSGMVRPRVSDTARPGRALVLGLLDQVVYAHRFGERDAGDRLACDRTVRVDSDAAQLRQVLVERLAELRALHLRGH